MMHIILKIIRVRVVEESKGQDNMLEVERPKEIACIGWDQVRYISQNPKRKR